MPGMSIVPDVDSCLLYPPAPPACGIPVSPHLRCSGQSMTLGEIGTRPHSLSLSSLMPHSLSLFSLTRLPPLMGASEVGSSSAAAEAAPPTSALLSAAESTDEYPTDTSPTSGASGLTHVGGSGYGSSGSATDSSGPASLRSTFFRGPTSSIARVLLAHDVRPGECLLQTFVGSAPSGVSSAGASVSRPPRFATLVLSFS